MVEEFQELCCFVFLLLCPCNLAKSGAAWRERRGGGEESKGLSVLSIRELLASPVERMPSPNDFAPLEPANTSRELGSKYS